MMGAVISTKVCLDFGITVPVVTILVGGGRGSLKNVRKTLEGQLPVVIVKGSGRLADLLAHVMQQIVPRYNSNVANRVMHALTVTSRCFYRFTDQKSILKELKKLSEREFGPTKNYTEIAEDINACINALPAKVSKNAWQCSGYTLTNSPHTCLDGCISLNSLHELIRLRLWTSTRRSSIL